MGSANYEIIGQHYSSLRKPDTDIANLIHATIGQGNSVVNIGAGTGSYEPQNNYVVAVGPSKQMLLKRKNRNPVIQALAEQLPFKSNSFDTALAILTLHHWNSLEIGLIEAKRVARSKIVILTWVDFPITFWLYDYFPELRELDKNLFPSIERLGDILGEIEVTPVLIPNNCTDGFLCAYWSRPESYLDAYIRSAISSFSRLDNIDLGLKNLEHDLQTGLWNKRYGFLKELKNYDLGYRLIVANIKN